VGAGGVPKREDVWGREVFSIEGTEYAGTAAELKPGTTKAERSGARREAFLVDSE